MELDAHKNEIEELKKIASDPEADEEDLRIAAARLREKLKPLGYTVVVRRTPQWYRGPKFQVLVYKIRGRGSGESLGEHIDWVY